MGMDAMIDKKGRLLGRLNVLDALVGLFIVFSVLGLLWVQVGGYRTSSAMIEGDATIEYTVHLSHVNAIHPEHWFNKGEPVALTVRNRPRGKVVITAVTHQSRQAIIPNGQGSYTLAPDPNYPHQLDMYITLRDKVMATKDGYVGNGVKLKQGSHVVLENKLTRVDGSIVDVTLVQQKP